MLSRAGRGSSAVLRSALAPCCVLLTGLAALPAQDQAAPAATPSITLLLREPRVLEVARVRRVLSRVLDVEIAATRTGSTAYVVADGEALVGRTADVEWRVESEAKPNALPPSSMRHLIVSDQEELAEHTAQLHVRCSAPCADEAAKKAAYRAIAGVTAALLARDVMAIGAAEHGTFDGFDGDVDSWRQRLLDEDPLSALRPVQSTSLVLFLAAPRTLDAKTVAAALTREWQRPIGSEGDADATEFVIEVRGTLMAKIGDDLLEIGARELPSPTAEELERYEDLRLRSLMQKRRQLVRCYVAGEPTPEQEAERRRLVARTAAALWGDDVLAASWHCDRRLAYPRDGLVEDLRAEDPVTASLRDPLVSVLEARDEAAMNAAIAKARSEWATAKAHFETGGPLAVKFPFATRSKSQEHMWIRVTQIDGDRVHGVLDNDPVDVEGLELGSPVARDVKELSDWLFEKDGKRFGGYTIEALSRRSGSAEAKEKAGGK